MPDLPSTDSERDAPVLEREVIWPQSRQLTPAALVVYMSIAYMLLYITSAVIAFLPFGLLHLVMPIDLVP